MPVTILPCPVMPAASPVQVDDDTTALPHSPKPPAAAPRLASPSTAVPIVSKVSQKEQKAKEASAKATKAGARNKAKIHVPTPMHSLPMVPPPFPPPAPPVLPSPEHMEDKVDLTLDFDPDECPAPDEGTMTFVDWVGSMAYKLGEVLLGMYVITLAIHFPYANTLTAAYIEAAPTSLTHQALLDEAKEGWGGIKGEVKECIGICAQ